MARFGHVLSAMITPFTTEGVLDLDEAQRLARWMQANGNDGLVLAGTTGEAPVLSDDERLALFAAVIEVVTIPVVAGTGTNDTAHSVHLTQEAKSLGASGILAVCPYYNRPSQAGIEAHMRAIAGASDLPVIIYDIPVRTGRKVSSASLLKLARDTPNIVGLEGRGRKPGRDRCGGRQCPRGLRGLQRRRQHDPAPPGRRCRRRDRCGHPLDSRRPPGDVRPVGQGDTAGARSVNARLLESFAFETGDDAPNPIPTKAMMRHLGFAVGQARLPMGPAPASVDERAPQVLAELKRRRGADPQKAVR